MIWLIIISRASQKITLEQCFSYEQRDYNFFPNEEGNPISFADYDQALDWVHAHVKPEMIDTDCSNLRHIPLREKYLL